MKTAVDDYNNPPDMTGLNGSVWRHKVRDTTYRITGCIWNAETNEWNVLYMSHFTAQWHARSFDKFFDGRFERVLSGWETA